MFYGIKEVSQISGVSIRMLHYYDKIGLLKPCSLSKAGYRQYDRKDIEKLQQILFYKELDFSLEEIKQIMNSLTYKKVQVLKTHEKLLVKKKEKMEALIREINAAVKSLEQGEQPQNNNIFTTFEMAEINREKEKLKKELMTELIVDSTESSCEKTENYSKDDWTVLFSRADAILCEIHKLMSSGADDPNVQRLIGDYKLFIGDSFWKCDNNVFKQLGDLYVENKAYRSYLERYSSDFPEFMQKAIYTFIGDELSEEN